MAERPDRDEWPERIATVDDEELYILAADGSIERRPLPDELCPGNVDAGRLAAFVISERVTQLWLHHSYAEQLPPDTLTDDEGYKISARGKRKSWFRLRHEGQEIFIVIPHRDSIRTSSAKVLTSAIWEFRAKVGFWYRISPAVVFDTMLRLMHPRLNLKGSLSSAEYPRVMLRDPVNEVWARPLSETERQRKYLHIFDKNGFYIGGAPSLAVGFGAPAYRAEMDFNPTLAAYWDARVTIPETWPCDIPLLNPSRQDQDGFSWSVTPTLTLAAQHGAKIEIREALVFPESHKVFATVQKRLRDSRRALATQQDQVSAIAANMVKSVYSRGIANLTGRAKRNKDGIVDLLRPDWRHFIIAISQANMIRNLLKYDLHPFAIRTDAIYLVSDSADPVIAANGLPLDPIELNSWKHVGCIQLNEAPDWLLSKDPIRNPQRYLDDLKALVEDKRHGA